MSSMLDGSKTTDFLGAKENMTNCNCSSFATTDGAFTIDHSDHGTRPMIIFVHSPTQELIWTDSIGCECYVFESVELTKDSFPIKSLRSDFQSIYFTNSTKGVLYGLNKASKEITKTQIDLSNFLLYGQYLQPHPPAKCLVPKLSKNSTLILKTRLSHSLVLEMPELKRHSDCPETTMPTVEYSLHYRKWNSREDSALSPIKKRLETFDSLVEVKNLRSFTKYIFYVSVSNYFSDSKKKTVLSTGVIFQTSAGGKYRLLPQLIK